MEQLLAQLLEHPELITKETIAALGDTYKKPLYAAISYLWDCMIDLVANDDYFMTNAQYTKKKYDAYIAVGFDEEQAMALLLNDNLQLMKNLKNAGRQNIVTKR